MTLTTQDRVHTLSVAVQAEREELKSAVDSNNTIAVTITLERLGLAEQQLADIMLVSAREKVEAVEAGDALAHAKALTESADNDPVQRRINTLCSENAWLRKRLDGAVSMLVKKKKQTRELRRASRDLKKQLADQAASRPSLLIEDEERSRYQDACTKKERR